MFDSFDFAELSILDREVESSDSFVFSSNKSSFLKIESEAHIEEKPVVKIRKTQIIGNIL
jgi:hypothetical protein